MRITKKIFGFFLAFVLLIASSVFVHAQTTTPSPTPDAQASAALQKKIAELEAKVSELKSQGQTLSSQIQTMDNQIKLTEYRIDATKQQITDLTLDIDSATKRMDNLEDSLQDVTKTLITRVVATYQMGYASPMQIFMESSDVSDFVARANYLRKVQEHDKQLLYDTQQARNDYANQKLIFEDKKKKIEALNVQLEEYSKQLDKDKETKEELLAVTKNDEAQYQKLLSEAKARVASFRTFALSQGGSILPPQSSPDGWYYNQRDSRWGNNYIGSSDMPLWQVGCLVTSTTMLRKQRGENVTPLDVARETSYFSYNTADMKIPWNGGKFSSSWGNFNSIQGGIDSKLANGQPVIVGLKVNSNNVGTHFIVLKSGANGSYIMNDPWNGPDLAFSTHYSTSQIFQYGWMN